MHSEIEEQLARPHYVLVARVWKVHAFEREINPKKLNVNGKI